MLLISPDAPSGQFFLYWALIRVNGYKCAKFQFSSSISYCDKVGVPKFNVGSTSPLPYSVRWNFYVCSKYLARSNSVPSFSIVSLCIMHLCEYVFSIGFPLYVPKKRFFGGFEGEDVKILCSNPQRHYPAWIRVCWCIACQNRFNSLSSKSVERFCVQRNKKMSGNFGYMGRRNPWGDLDQMWLVGRYGGRNHVCNIWW